MGKASETEMCDACNGSGFGVADTYCGKCGGAGGYPMPETVPVDSGMDGDTVTQAEWLWTNLPTRVPWTSLQTHEKALVCHTLARFRAPSSATPEVSELVEQLRKPSQWCCIFEHEGQMRHGKWEEPFKAATALETLEARVRELERPLNLVHHKWLEYKAGDIRSDKALDEIFDLVVPAVLKQLSGDGK